MTQLSYSQLEDLWQQAGGSAATAPMAAAIAMAESGGQVGSISAPNPNGSRDWGLWQINNGGDSQLDPLTNAKTAVAMSRNGTDWHPWCTAYSDGACGTRGGHFLGAGSPFFRFLRGGAPPVPGSTVPAGQTPGSLSANLVSSTAPADTCLAKFPEISAGPIHFGGWCIVSRSLGQKIVGAGALLAGGVILLIGLFRIAGRQLPALPSSSGTAPSESAEQKYYRENFENEQAQRDEDGPRPGDRAQGAREARTARRLKLVRDSEDVAA